MAYQPGKGSWNNRGSWKDSVRKPRDGSPCRHERHAQFALRSVLHRFEWQAEKDDERFVWFGIRFLIKMCKDIQTGEGYSRSMLEKCVRFLLDSGIIRPATRVRLGEVRAGHIVADHVFASEIVGSKCVFGLDKSRADSVANSASDSALYGADSVANSASNGHRTPHADGKRTPHQQKSNQMENKVVRDDSGSALPSQESSTLPSQKSLSSHSLRSLEGSEGFAIHQLEYNSCDLTKARPGTGRKVGGLRTLSFEEQLDVLTDGVFQTTTLEHYDDRDVLQVTVQDVVEKYAMATLDNRTVCKTLCEHINGALLRCGIKPPGGWVPTLRELKRAGALQITPKDGESESESEPALLRVKCRPKIEKRVLTEQEKSIKHSARITDEEMKAFEEKRRADWAALGLL
jgi:hypothetical protein